MLLARNLPSIMKIVTIKLKNKNFPKKGSPQKVNKIRKIKVLARIKNIWDLRNL